MPRGPRTTRTILVACLAGSAVVHAGTLGMLAYYKTDPRDRLTDAPGLGESSTMLTLVAPAPVAAPAPEPAPEQRPEPKPEPIPQPAPAPPREPEPEPIKFASPPPTPRSIIEYSPLPPPRRESAPVHTLDVAAQRPSASSSSASAAQDSPVAVFAGVQARRASRIVYAVDASGAMASSLPFVLDEVMRSVNRLQPTQSFQVVLFRESPDGSPAMSPLIFSDRLTPATEENRSRLAAWLSAAEPAGKSNPLSGLEPALSFDPDLIFLLTRSIKRSGPQTEWGPGNRAVLQRLEQLNPRDASNNRKVVIKTIQFLDADPTGLLQSIADSHGDGPGSSRTLTLEELEER